jgi:hypothetical protein
MESQMYDFCHLSWKYFHLILLFRLIVQEQGIFNSSIKVLEQASLRNQCTVRIPVAQVCLRCNGNREEAILSFPDIKETI